MDTLNAELVEKIKLQIHKANLVTQKNSNLIEPYSTKEKYLQEKHTHCFSLCNVDLPEFEYDEDNTSSSESEHSFKNIQNFLQE